MKQRKCKTLVIGGGGYIGVHLIQQLIDSGRSVTVLGRSASPRSTLPKEAVYVSGDFSQRKLITGLLDMHSEVIQLAYATVPNTSFEDPLADLQQNLPANVQLFTEVADRGIKLVLVSSGGTVYGEAQSVPITEAHPTRPISPYGVTKLTLENYAFLYAATHGLKFVCVRPANGYGVGQRPFIGQGFIATAMASALKGMPIKIFGTHGTVRDYLYVNDIASGILFALEHGNLSQTYNLGSGLGLSNLEIVEKMTPLLCEVGCKVRVDFQSDRAFDVRVNVLDSSKIRQDTNWSMKIDLTNGLALTRDWLIGVI